MTLQNTLKRRHSGFTLVELLVVIGIIVILIGILLPVAANVRKKGWVTSTTQEMSRIGSACQAYYNDFHAYPGPISESKVDVAPAGTNATGIPTAPNVTSSQNLVLGLLGGLYFPTGSTTITYSPTQVTAGPQSLNSLNVKQYTAYMDATPEELPTQNTTGTTVYTSYLTVRGVSTKYVVPEFLDHIPIDQAPYYMPILYIRARVGSPGIVTTSLSPTSPQQYTFAQLSMYPQSFNNAVLFTDASVQTADTSNGTPGTTDYPTPNPNPPTGSPAGTMAYPTNDNAFVYFANPAFFGQPRGKDSFILISAGSDHIFGTSDDIIYSQ